MADLSQFLVNLDTPQPGGRQGESPRAAFTKYNDLLGALEGELEGITYEHISATAPVETYPFMPWVDTGVSPPMLRRRNADDTAWVAVMPAIVPLGTASQKDMPPGVDELGTIVGFDVPPGVDELGTIIGLDVPPGVDELGTIVGFDVPPGVDELGTIIGLDVPPGVDEVFHRLNILGTVSESGGVPTGAIFEEGANASGEFIRFASGLQICVRGNFFETPEPITYIPPRSWPAVFASSPYCFVFSTSTAGTTNVTGAAGATPSQTASLYTTGLGNGSVSYLGIGWWK